MWIGSKHGFFSIVRKPFHYHIRARVRKDLENLVGSAKIKSRVIETEKTDYRYRILVNGWQMQKVFKALEDSVDYSNFKNMVSATKSQSDKYTLYSDVWKTMESAQDVPAYWDRDAYELHVQNERIKKLEQEAIAKAKREKWKKSGKKARANKTFDALNSKLKMSRKEQKAAAKREKELNEWWETQKEYPEDEDVPVINEEELQELNKYLDDLRESEEAFEEAYGEIPFINQLS